METQTARTEATKILKFVIIVHVTKKLSLLAKTANAYLNCGCAILIMTAEMILMNRLTCVGNGIVPLDGNDALDALTTGSL